MNTHDPANVCRRKPCTCAGAALVVALGWLAAGAAHGAIMDITASTNAYVLRSSGGDDDQNEAETLQTKRLNDSNTRVAYLRFNLPAGLNENDVNAASLFLKLTTNSGTTVTTDTVNVLGLSDGASNGAVTEANWTDTIVFLTQPAGAVPNNATALPNANTTGVLGTAPLTVSNATPPVPLPALVEVPLNIADFRTFLAGDTNDQVTLLFHNLNNVIISWASITNTGGQEVPTLRLDVVPEPGSAGMAIAAGLFALARRRHRA